MKGIGSKGKENCLEGFHMKIQLSNGEWKLMHVLWEQGSSTITELTKHLAPDTGWSKHTIITMLSRLEGKGAVSHQEGMRAKRYFPQLRKEEAAHFATEQFLSRVYGGSLGLMLNAMVSNHALSQEDIDELSTILEQAKEENSS